MKKRNYMMCRRNSMAFMFHMLLHICNAMGVVSTKGVANMLYDLSNLDQYHHCNITTAERTARHIRSGKRSLFFIMLFFILQKRDYTTTKVLHQSPHKNPLHLLTVSSTNPFNKPPPRNLYSACKP